MSGQGMKGGIVALTIAGGKGELNLLVAHGSETRE